MVYMLHSIQKNIIHISQLGACITEQVGLKAQHLQLKGTNYAGI